MNDSQGAVNHQLLELARNFAGLTQKELATRTGLTQGTISKVESGLQDPPSTALQAIAKALGFPDDFFLQPVNVLPPSTPFQRKRKSLSPNIYRQIEAQANIYRIHSEWLLKAVEVTTHFPPDTDEPQSPAQVAKSLRRFLRVPRGPIRNLTRLVEGMGVFIYGFDFGTDLIDGFAMSTDANNYIFANARLPTDRYRFSVAHELGHLLMHEYPHQRVEEEANEFAAEFLMPADDIRAPLSAVRTLDQLERLKPYWRVSIAAMIMRLTSLQLRTANQARYMWAQLSERGWKKHEPVVLDPEPPSLVDELLDTYRNGLGYSSAELSKALRVYPDLFARLYSRGNNRIFTIVK